MLKGILVGFFATLVAGPTTSGGGSSSVGPSVGYPTVGHLQEPLVISLLEEDEDGVVATDEHGGIDYVDIKATPNRQTTLLSFFGRSASWQPSGSRPVQDVSRYTCRFCNKRFPTSQARAGHVTSRHRVLLHPGCSQQQLCHRRDHAVDTEGEARAVLRTDFR